MSRIRADWLTRGTIEQSMRRANRFAAHVNRRYHQKQQGTWAAIVTGLVFVAGAAMVLRWLP